MSSQVFLWVNLGVAVLLVLIFLIGRKSFQTPTKLNLRKGNQETDRKSNSKTVARPEKRPDVHFKTANQDAGEKSLNVMFMYNGHSFDAHEVLGVPAGARLEMVQSAFDRELKKRPSEKDFLEAAITAIRRG